MAAILFRLEVPARPEAVRVIRFVASGAAADADMSYDRLDDLGLAIDEASATLLDWGAEGTLVCEAAPAARGLELSISAHGDAVDTETWPPDSGSLAEVVLRAIAAAVAFDSVDDRPTVTFVVE